MKLDFAIIGGQKCGSTYLHHVISEHPEVEMVSGESPQFEDPDYHNGGLKDMRLRLNELDQSKVLGIKRPNYLTLPEVPSRLKEANPNVKLIVIVRNPLERFKSSYFHLINNGFCPAIPLNKGAEQILNGELKRHYPRTEEVLEFGFYNKHLDNYLSLFGDKVLLLTYDELNRDKMDVIKRCYAFLEIDQSFIPEKILNSRPQKVNYSLQRAKLISKMYNYRYCYNEQRTRLYEKDQSLMDKIMWNGLYILDKMVLQFTLQSPKPDYDGHIKERLLETYQDDIIKLESKFGYDLSNWRN